MTFLAPTAGIIAAAIALPALLLLYLLRLRRRPLRVSSTLLWEQAAKDLQVNVPFRTIRWSWLLLLHLIALACFVIAIARPAIGDGGIAGSRVIIAIDCSASMSAADIPPATPGGVPRSRLDAAKDRAIELIDSIGRSGGASTRPRCMIVSTAAAPTARTGFTSDLRTLREAIESIEPTDQPDNLAAFLQLVDATSAGAQSESEAALPRPAVYLVTDRVAAPPTAREQRGIHPVVLTIGDPAAAPDNVGIVAVSARHDVEDFGLIRVFARLVSSNPRPVDVAVRCTVNTQLLDGGIAGITLPAATTAANGAITPGESAAVFAVRPALASSTPRAILISINRADALASDDTAGLLLPPPWRPRILVVVPDPPSTDAAPRADVFLEQALDAAEPATVRIAAASSLSMPNATPQQLAQRFAGFDIVVFDRAVPTGPLPDVPTLSFGVQLPLDGLVVEPSTPGRDSTGALAWKRDHPALQYVGLDTLLVAPAATIRLPESTGDLAVESLVEGDAGPLIAEVRARTRDNRPLRRIVVAFDLARSNWGPDISFPVFIGNALEYLADSGETGRAAPVVHTTTDLLRAVMPGVSRTVIASGPAEARFENADADEPGETIAFGPLPRAGVYALTDADGRAANPPAMIVNTASERESALAPTLGDSTAAPAMAASGPSDTGEPGEIWHWFILAALVPLTIEWFVYAWQMRGA